jgi:hypothetical protein
MRALVLIIGLIVALSPLGTIAAPMVAPKSGTAISNQQATAFFNQCRGEPVALQGFSPMQRELFCACTAANIQKNLVVEDIQAMANTQTTAGRAALAKMLETVHFPCSLRPIEDSVRQECIARAARNPQFAQAGQRYCGCLANRMINYVRTVGVKDTLRNLAATGQLVEPMGVLQQSSGYNNELLSSYYTCFNGVLP